MANRRFEKYFLHTSYGYDEILAQVKKLQSQYDKVDFQSKKDQFTVYIQLKPTEGSLSYTVKLCCRVGSSKVDVYVVDPKIGRRVNGKPVPHMYSDGTLCLYYPRQREWTIEDDWGDTLIPWISLWLFYYELWLETGEWLGGGKHPD